MSLTQERPPVEVLLATFNGSRFLREQIDSILAQDYPALRILASDDGSRDGTAEILAEYAMRSPERMRVLAGLSPTGSAKANFLRLIQASSAAYAGFADQDDVWVSDKIGRSMDVMRTLERQHGADRPLLVFTDLRVVDARLETVAESFWRQAKIDIAAAQSLPRLLGQSVVTGCTMLVNRPLLDLAKRMPEEATMHDRWIGLLAAATGAASALPEPTVLYRQHDRNVIGAAATDDSLAGLAGRTADDTGRRAERARCERQAEALLRLHAGEMPAEKVKVLQAYLRSGRSASAAERLWLTLRFGFFRGTIARSAALLVDLARRQG